MAEQEAVGGIGPIQARLQVPSSEWLKVHSLSGQQLSLDQILPGLGFKQKEGHVPALNCTVTSHYGDGMFTQHPNSKGYVYNLCGGSRERLEETERRLQEVVAMLKARHTWLNTGSRLHFGVLYGQRVVMVMDSCATEHSQLKLFLDVACDVLRDQFSHVEKFTVMRCTSGVECWNAELVKVSSETIAAAVDWVAQTLPQTPPIKTNTAEALIKALSLMEADNIYLFTQGTASLRAFDLLLEKASPSLIPVHVVVFGCNDSDALDKYRQLAQVSGAKCHCYAPPTTPPPSHHSSLMSLTSAASISPPTFTKRPMSGQESANRPASAASSVPSRPTSASKVMVSFLPPANFPLGNEDAELVWAELERARDTLADIQALCLEENGYLEGLEFNGSRDTISEDYMTSEQWLEVHGLKANKLLYHNLVGSLAFRHCNGRVQLPHPSKSVSTGLVEMIPHSKIVHAQYCKEFVHIRWEGKRVVHVELTERIHHTYQDKVKRVLSDCCDRLAWLKQGSRELFGTLLEERLVVVIDTSSSMKDRLDLVKAKIQQLIMEQLKEKAKFSLFHFNSSVHCWREHLVPTSEQNLKAVSQWVEGLTAEGSTNTMAALSQAMSVRGAQAVYLLTDGRPNQPESEVLGNVQQLPNIPVHTISFNCADSKANSFLAQLSKNTGGRYYYYSEDVSDPDGPKTYESDDIHRLVEEMECAEEQLSLASQLLAECCAARKRCGGRKQRTTKKSEHKQSPSRSSGGRKSKRFMSTKRWLQKNSLSALKLTLMDALGPSAIPHSAKDVPILDKKITSKVFNSVFPLAHVANGNKVTLINPGGVDLRGYEERLQCQTDLYWERLTKLAWDAVPTEKRDSTIFECVGEGSEVTDPLMLSYKDHRDVLRKALEDLGWPRPQINFDLLETEIKQAENFLKYSAMLREESRRGSRPQSSQNGGRESRRKSRSISMTEDDGGSSISLFSAASGNSLIELLDQLELHTVTPSPPHRSTRPPVTSKKTRLLQQNLRSQRVIARSNEDGFYYPGLVLDHVDSRHVLVRLADGHQITVRRRFVIQIGGASPCPVLLVGDHVLVQVRTRKGPHPSKTGSCDYFIPGTVQVLPEDSRKGHALHTVLVFNGRSVTCPRRGVVKISESMYKAICKFINARMSDLHSRSHSKVELESKPDDYASDFSDEQSALMSTSNIQGSTTHSPLATSPTHSSPERNKTPLTPDKVDGTSQRVGFPPQEYEAEIQLLLTNQQTQNELLEQYQRDLADLQNRQSHMELEMKKKEEGDRRVMSAEESVDAGDTHNLNLQLISQQANEDKRWISGEQGMENGTMTVECREVAVNTGPWMEEKAVETDPVTESRGVGTEWSDSSCCSQSDNEVESTEREAISDQNQKEAAVSENEQDDDPVSDDQKALSEHLSSESTPVPSPLRASTPVPSTPSHSVSPPQSKQSTPQHTTTPSPHHTNTPSPHHTNTPSSQELTVTPSPSHKGTPSPVHITTPVKTPVHERDSLLVAGTENKRDLSSIARQLVELGVDAFVGREVLARWPDNGWYYRAKIVRRVGQHHYQVKDVCDELETVHISSIITDTQDAETPLQVGGTVVALHPDYTSSYVPGHVTAIHTTADPVLHYSVQLYDGSSSFLPRHEVYNLPPNKHKSDVEYLNSKEKAWLGQEVIARSERNGFYYHGTVEELGEEPGHYLVRWPNGDTQKQEVIHIFGPFTKRRELRIGDYVIAQTQSKHLGACVCMPGQIKASTGRLLQIKFCDAQIEDVDPNKNCFWITKDYYQTAVEFICLMEELSSRSRSPTISTTSRSETDVLSEYSASYPQ